MTVRTRFAPSPTGFLHVGSARTALFSYLFAKKHGGTFILRIEDTDLARSTPEAVQAILDGMAWLGLNADEGPFYQTQRFDRYALVTEQWLETGKAYRCYCTKERTDALREAQMLAKEKPRYDHHCRDLTVIEDKPFVVRFKNPLDGEVVIDDAVHGTVVFANRELDDLIIARNDGTPTYNFTVVVDDADMRISHVIRGDDHLNNTPRQINMLLALNAPLPAYAHLPMILGDDGKKLSKRHGAVSVMDYYDQGFIPEALLNYLVRLGWSHGDQEIFSMAEMQAFFDLDHLSKSAAAFNTEKLEWLNQHYLKTLPLHEVLPLFRAQLIEQAMDLSHGPALEVIYALFKERVKTLKEMASKARFFFEIPDSERVLQSLVGKIDAIVLAALKALYQAFIALDANAWDESNLQACLEQILLLHSLKLGKVGPAIRIILAGENNGLPIYGLLASLGRGATLGRLEAAIHAVPAASRVGDS